MTTIANTTIVTMPPAYSSNCTAAEKLRFEQQKHAGRSGQRQSEPQDGVKEVLGQHDRKCRTDQHHGEAPEADGLSRAFILPGPPTPRCLVPRPLRLLCVRLGPRHLRRALHVAQQLPVAHDG